MSENNYRVFIDDKRMPQQCMTYMSDMEYNAAWTVVRSFKEFTEVIDYNFRVMRILPEVISFDHDLVFSHEGDEQKEKSGYDCAKWMVDFCKREMLPFPRYKVHSRHEVGIKNIIGEIEFFKMHYKYEKQNA